MNTRTSRLALGALSLSLVGAAAWLGVWATPVATATPAPASAPLADATFKVDPVHSSVVFKVKHMNVANFYGRFNEVSGAFTSGETASIDVTVKADSVDTNNKARDKHVMNEDFFDVKAHSTITFTAKGLTKAGDSWKGKGDLTFRGVTKPLEITLVQTGTGKGRGGGELVGLESTFTIKRSDFGNNKEGLSDEVTLTVALECGSGGK